MFGKNIMRTKEEIMKDVGKTYVHKGYETGTVFNFVDYEKQLLLEVLLDIRDLLNKPIIK